MTPQTTPGSSYSLLLIEWPPEVPRAEVDRLTRAWGAKIAAKRVVSSVSFQTPQVEAIPEPPEPEPVTVVEIKPDVFAWLKA